MVSIGGRKMTLACTTVFHNGSIDTSFVLTHLRFSLNRTFTEIFRHPDQRLEDPPINRVNPKFKPNLLDEIFNLKRSSLGNSTWRFSKFSVSISLATKRLRCFAFLFYSSFYHYPSSLSPLRRKMSGWISWLVSARRSAPRLRLPAPHLPNRSGRFPHPRPGPPLQLQQKLPSRLPGRGNVDEIHRLLPCSHVNNV